MPATLLEDRGALRLAGEQAVEFLQGLVTNEVSSLSAGEARYAALLTPQGKILCDFFVVRPLGAATDTLFIDAPRDRLPELAQRLSLYKLRARIAIENLADSVGIAAAWGEADEGRPAADWFADPRRPRAGARAFVPLTRGWSSAEAGAYETHRIALGLPKGGVDFLYGDAFPQEADMDRLNGVSFQKGCYVGQEVVSRMHHRGTARNRVLRVGFIGPPPPPSAEIRAGEILLGRMGSAVGGQGLAMLRTDRVEEAVSAGVAITSGDVVLRLLPPTE